MASPVGLPCDLPVIAVSILTRYQDTTTLRFVFDTGADLMAIPTYIARREGIPFREEYPGALTSSVGGTARCYYDFVQVRSSLSGKTHRWVCAFVESAQARLILGRSGFLDDFAGVISGRFCVVEHPVSPGQWARERIASLWQRPRQADDWRPI
jgi:hypothetical protein